MKKLIWLLVLAIPLWLAAELHAPKWVLTLTVIPFFIYASTLGDSDEDLLGEGFARKSKVVLLLLVIGGVVLFAGLFSFVCVLTH
jgi:hypothetical protein